MNPDRETPMTTDPAPFGSTVDRYIAAGWLGPLPLPAGAKKAPPSGYTGADGAYATVTDIDTWRTHNGTGNIGLRMADNIIGIDVDNYGTKPGGATLDRLTEQLGPLPDTWISTSRLDGVSGIRYYRLPEPVKLIGALPGIEIIQRHHRYAVVAPSIHPEGRPYLWLHHGEVVDIPNVNDLPTLPGSWVDHLRADRRTSAERHTLATGADTSPAVERTIGRALMGLTAGTRHDTTLRAVTALLRLETQEHPGASQAITDLERAFLNAVTTDGTRSDREAQGEWDRMVDSATTEVATTPSIIPRWEPTPEPPDPDRLGLTALGLATTTPGGVSIAEAVEQGDWAPIDLTDALAGADPPTPELLAPTSGPALIYPGRVNSLFGESGTGKTWVTLHVLAEAVRDGHNVAIIDLEDNPHGIVSRLAAIGLTGDQIASHVDYLAPQTPWSGPARDAVTALIRERQHRLVIIDSTGEAMAMGGVKGNNDDEVAAWFRSFPRHIADLGPAVIVVDHIPKATDAPSGFAIGSQRKLAAVNGAAYRVDAVRVPSRTENGLLRLTCAKDRHGTHQKGAVAAMVHIDHNELDQTIAITATAPDEMPRNPDGTARPTIYMEKVSRAVENTPKMSRRDIVRVVGGKDKYVSEALGQLVAEGYVDAEPRAGRGGGFVYSSVEPYRNDVASQPLSKGDEMTDPEPRPNRGPTAAQQPGRGSNEPRPRPPTPTGSGRGSDRPQDQSSNQTAAPDVGPRFEPQQTSDWMEL